MKRENMWDQMENLQNVVIEEKGRKFPKTLKDFPFSKKTAKMHKNKANKMNGQRQSHKSIIILKDF